MIAVEELPVIEEVDEYKKYCHVVCSCSPEITLCGAYRPQQCGISVLMSLDDICPKCKKPTCPDCADMMYEECPRRCGI